MRIPALLPWLSTILVGLTALHAQTNAPRFQSLTPARPGGQAQTSWVQHLNEMKEAERQQRVQTFGMPPAPPNRWAQAPRQQPAPRPAAPYQEPQAVRQVPAVPVRAQAVRQVQAASFQPQPEAGWNEPVVKTRLVSWKPSQLAKKPERQSPEQKLRQQVAFIPSRITAETSANPYAPYANRAEYQRAISRSAWEPRAKSADILRKQQQQEVSRARSTEPKKRKWGIGALFKRRSKSESPSKAPQAERRATAPRLPSSHVVTTGLPQLDDGGAWIDTTLLGN